MLMPICRRLERQLISRALPRAVRNTGNRSAANTPIIAMTVSSSTRVKASLEKERIDDVSSPPRGRHGRAEGGAMTGDTVLYLRVGCRVKFVRGRAIWYNKDCFVSLYAAFAGKITRQAEREKRWHRHGNARSSWARLRAWARR